jgi:hypothetical protein
MEAREWSPEPEEGGEEMSLEDLDREQLMQLAADLIESAQATQMRLAIAGAFIQGEIATMYAVAKKDGFDKAEKLLKGVLDTLGTLLHVEGVVPIETYELGITLQESVTNGEITGAQAKDEMMKHAQSRGVTREQQERTAELLNDMRRAAEEELRAEQQDNVRRLFF